MSFRFDDPDTVRAAVGTYIKLRRAANSLNERVDGYLPGKGLTESQFAVLEVLNALGPLCQRDIGKKILKSKANITLVVDNLEDRTLVERSRDSEDRRMITVRLTPKGRRFIQEILVDHYQVIFDAMSALSVEEMEELGRLCRKLGKSISES